MRDGLLLFFAGLLASVIVASGHLNTPDGELLFRVAQSVALRGETSVEPIAGFATMKGRDGREYAQYGLGQPLLAVPLVWLGEGLGRVLGERAGALAVDAATQSYALKPNEIARRFAVSFFNAFILGLQMALLGWFARRLTGSRRAAMMTALAYGLATLALPHSRTFFTEPLATLCVFGALAFLHVGLERGAARWLIAGGALAGYAVLVRVDSVVVWPALLAYLGRGLWLRVRPKESETAVRRGPVEALRLGAAFLAPMAAGAGLILAYNYARFGSIFEQGYGDQPEGVNFGTPLLVGLHGFLCSPGRGLFFFSPPLILALFGFGALNRRCRPLTLAVAFLILSKLFFHAKWINWPGGWVWGPRHIFMIHAFLALPLAAWLAERPAARARGVAFAALFAVGFAVQIYGSSQNFFTYYNVMFRQPYQQPTARALYDASANAYLAPYYRVQARLPDPSGSGREPAWVTIPWSGMASPIYGPLFVPAPINDSVYVPQNSCWYGYAALARAGMHDFLWLRLLGVGVGANDGS